MIRNIIFDWSGTLSDDLIPVYKAIMNVFRKLGLRTLSLDEFKKEYTAPFMHFYRKFKPDVSKEHIDKLYYKEISSVGEPKPFKGVGTILEFLEQKGVRIAVLSSHPQEKLEREIKSYGFQKFFVDISGGVQYIMEKNAFKAGETAYVGDMTHDVEAGKRAKVMTIAVSWGYQPRDELLKSKPDFLIDDLEELKKLI